MAVLGGALSSSGSGLVVAPAAGAAPAPPAAPSAGVNDDTEAVVTKGTRALTLGLFAVGLLLAWLIPETKPPFAAKEGFTLFAGFYVGAQAIERVLEIVLPAGGQTKQAKTNRALLFPAIAFVIAIIAAEYLGLYYLKAVGVQAPGTLDIIITALAIAGGTKPLHDFIKQIEKAKEPPSGD